MKLFIRDIFEWRDSRWRLLHIEASNHACWIIEIDSRHAWPIKVSLAEIEHCSREANHSRSLAMILTKAAQAKHEADYARLQIVLNGGWDLFNKSDRRKALADVALEVNRCSKTLAKLLRRYWQRGMTKEALLPDYKRCGRRKGGETGGRGRQPRASHAVYQITEQDHPRLEAAIARYFAEPRLSLDAAYDLLCDYYVYEDGNGDKYVCGLGERPSSRQFSYYFKSRYSLETRTSKRVGEKEYAREHKPKLSDTIADCAGVGHRYEIDASIADVLIVHATDRATIVGKATVYLIVDRKSRLIVGFYLGLENACWETAVEAIVSLVEPKDQLCARYGVEYRESDWPADGILPMEFLGDNGEMIARASSQLPQALGVTIANTASLLPNHKPNVETRFKLITLDLRNIAPGYEPPEHFGKRRTKRYDKEACLTLDELIAEILETIIKHNRSPLAGYARSADEILRGVEPSPIELWNDGVNQTGCLGRRFDEHSVRAVLLPRGAATITHDGLVFKNLYYTSEDPRLQRAFARAKKGRDSITVSYDRRSIDSIYVHLPAEMIVATLSDRTHGFTGLSFREAQFIDEAKASQAPALEQKRRQVNFESRQRRRKRIQEAESKRDALGNLSINARKLNTVEAREDQKRVERTSRTDRIVPASSQSARPTTPPANVTGLPVENRAKSTAPHTPTAAQLARKRMIP